MTPIEITEDVYLYSRASTNKQETSTEFQEYVLKPYCASRCIDNYISLIDNDTSGTKPLLKRPSGSKLVALKKGSWIISTKVDRLFRSVSNGSSMLEKWKNLGVNVVLLDISPDPLNFKDAMQQFMVNIALSAAQFERDKTSDRTENNLRIRKSTGKTYSAAPYGFDNVYTEKNNKGAGINGKLVPNEAEQQVIAQIKHFKSLDKSLNWIASWLNEKQIPSKKGGLWSAKTVSDVLKNSLNNLD